MGLEAVVGEIKTKGENETGRIRNETREEVTRILMSAQERAGKVKLDADAEVDRQIQHIKGQETSAANLVVKRKLLNTEKELLDQVYQATLRSIASQPENFHREAQKKLLATAKQEIQEGTVHCNARDMPSLKQLIGTDSAFRGYVTGKVMDFEGGIIVESTDGQLKLDLSYRTFLDRVWEKGLKDASDILFG
ncbi:MAG: V-type ATP synthase subunit E [Methanoregulaceae archaeon]|jgi:V/A-type H+/Na+-transporting ATPase subunit E|nr:V-type ATP synthase subunit E [Methanoregulaceae archaeon]